MNKTIALAAIAALAMGSEQFGENELNVFKSIGNGLKKAGHFVAEHPQIITQASKILAHDDEELFNIHSALHKVEDGAKKAGHYVAEHPEVINQAIQILKNFKHDDEELFNIHNAAHKVEEGVKKAEHYVYDHRHQIEQGAKKAVDYIQQHPEVVNKAIEIIKNLRHHDDEELFHLGKAIHNVAHAAGKVGHIAKDGLNLYKDVQTGNIAGAINHGKALVHDAKNIKHDDEELFHLGKAIHNVAHAVGKVEHIAKDGINLYKDVQTGNIAGAINHGKAVVHDVKNIKHDDEELFNIHNAIHKAEEGVKKAEHYVYDHRHQIEQGAKKAVDYIQQHPEVVNKAIEIIKNLRHHDDEELFHLGKAIHNVAHAVGKVEHIAKDGVSLVKDVKTGNIAGAINNGKALIHDVKNIKHDDEELFNLDAFLNDAVKTYNDVRQKDRNYGNIVNDGIQLVKDIKQKKHDDEELFHLGKAIHNVAHAVGKVEHIAKDGVSLVKDVKTGNIAGAINNGKALIHDVKNIKHDDEELFNLDAFLNDAVKTYNDARQNPRNYGNLVNDGIQLVKDIKQKKHDDEELFHLGKVVHNVAHAVGKVEHIAKDGVNLYKDVKTGNIAGAINNGKALVHDVKNIKHDDEELFNLGTLINDGMNIYKDVKSKNYGGLVNDGIQTVKDVKKNLRHH